MKLNYYGYYVLHHTSGVSALVDLRPFVSAFCALRHREYKNSFSYNGENIYLFHSGGGPIYLLAMTRDQEIIKAINAEDVSVSEIHDRLAVNERLGFASYVYLGENYFGIASTLMAPRIKALSHLINEIFSTIGLRNYSFNTRALLYQAERDEVFRLPVVGRTTIEVENGAGGFAQFFDVFGGNGDHLSDVSSFEITIKPRPRQDIKEAISRFSQHFPNESLRKFVVKAKADLDDQLTDLYIVGRGAISDLIDKGSEVEVRERILEAVDNNDVLKEKVIEFQGDKGFDEEFDGADFARFTSLDTWAAILSPLQPGD